MDSLLLEVVKMNSEAKKQPAVGILTSENRDRWADAYRTLQDLGNQPSLDAVNSAMLAVSLESTGVPLTSLDEKAKFMFCGNNAANRWFDKSLNFIVLPDGTTGCNGEHSPCDAVVPSRMIDFIIQRFLMAESRDEETPGYLDYANSDSLPSVPVHVQWTVDESLLVAIANAQKHAQTLVDDTAVAVIHEPQLTSNLFKSTRSELH
jgi:hypothetical protein